MTIRIERKNRFRWVTTLVVVMLVLLLLTMAEYALRAVMEETQPILYRYELDNQAIKRLNPSVRAVTRFNNQMVVSETNSHGMPWREVDVVRSSDAPRIAFVGDSFTFGFWAPDRESAFVGVVDQKLASRGYEILNFGIPGHGFWDSERLLRDEVLRFDPDLVVLASYNGNDFMDTWLQAERERRGYDGRLSGLEVKSELITEDMQQGERIHKSPELGDRLNRFVRRLAIHKALVRVGLIDHHIPPPHRDTELVMSEHVAAFSYWSQRPYPEFAQEVAATSVQKLADIHELLCEQNIELLIISIPYVEQVYVTKPKGEYYDLAYPQQLVGDFAAGHNIPWLDLMGPLRELAAASDERLYAYDDDHWNAYGHRKAGELVSEWLSGMELDDLRSCMASSRAGSGPE